jgi:hypothetical protein
VFVRRIRLTAAQFVGIFVATNQILATENTNKIGSLTDIEVRNAKPGSGARKLSDGKGLHLLITPSGGKLWRLQYRFEGKQKTLALGEYPAVTVAVARGRATSAKNELDQGRNPSAQARIAKLTKGLTDANTFELIAEEFLTKYEREGRAEATVVKAKWLIDFARPALGKRTIAEIAAIEVLAVLWQVEGRGRLETARRLRSTISCAFWYAIATAPGDD